MRIRANDLIFCVQCIYISTMSGQVAPFKLRDSEGAVDSMHLVGHGSK